MRSRWNVQYMQRVLATDPIAYWMQDEKEGLVSHDMVTARSNAARNGVYTGVTLREPGIGDGRTSALYDGVNDYDDIYSVNLNAAFNGQAVTVGTWVRVSAVGVWADGATRYLVHFRVNGNNRIILNKAAAANQIGWVYSAGGVNNSVALATFAGRTEWIPLFLTADLVADEMIAYADGVQAGAIQNGLGAWAGNLDAVRVLTGANNQIPINVWDGWLAHTAVWDRALSPAEVLSLGCCR